MIRINMSGMFRGLEPSKSYPDKVFMYVKPTAPVPNGLLHLVNCVPERHAE